ncbi:MAG: hypothetical protein MAG551_01209 [Candidatus Scalindua arabica]|uniref:Uncharacterized protein n=1 Tax=Candidatus Scalindua arabica TaxID=1127984 RepID=A0A941W3D1_9BACT|nr:hypothetical protein [Candidatus Scalindua arabica]
MNVSEICKEGYDTLDLNHPFWNCSKYPYYKLAKESCPFLSEKELPEQEYNILVYIWHSLEEKQEYDGGNAILVATQKGLLSIDSMMKIANYIVSKNVKFRSKIGKIIFVKITRSLGLALFLYGERDIGLKLWLSSINATKKMKYGKDMTFDQWQTCSTKVTLPSELQDKLTLMMEK